jgi:hypothetical protein
METPNENELQVAGTPGPAGRRLPSLGARRAVHADPAGTTTTGGGGFGDDDDDDDAALIAPLARAAPSACATALASVLSGGKPQARVRALSPLARFPPHLTAG